MDRDFILKIAAPLAKAGSEMRDYELFIHVSYGVQLEFTTEGPFVTYLNKRLEITDAMYMFKEDAHFRKFISYELSTIRVISNKFIELLKNTQGENK